MRNRDRFISLCGVLVLGVALVGCGGGSADTASASSPGSAGQSQSAGAAQRATFNAAATPAPEGTDPLAAAVINAFIAIVAKDKAGIDALSTAPLSDTDAETAYACTGGGTSPTIESQQATVNGTSATVAVKFRSNAGFAIRRASGTWELVQQGDGSWKLSAAPVCTQG
ncbi:MAG: hypothetical protein CVU47_06480 [Chloroflexi bacterium HGW-Chloroflexi-9]|nr:MAG: hypothetical protein CVU47_06480 [Chloroflexi bacterium HGW-Chloroflexi-9]